MDAPVPGSFLVWGSGGHGRVVGELIRALGHEVAGYVDRDVARVGARVGSHGVVSHLQDELLLQLERTRAYPEGVSASALGIGDNRLRVACIDRLEGLLVPPLIHPSATVSSSAELGRGTVVFPHVVVNAGARIEDAVILNSGAIVEHDCILERGAHASPGATLCGGVSVGTGSWIGAGATLIPGVRVGRDAIVGAGATVVRDVPDGDTVAGTPARSLRAMS